MKSHTPGHGRTGKTLLSVQSGGWHEITGSFAFWSLQLVSASQRSTEASLLLRQLQAVAIGFHELLLSRPPGVPDGPTFSCEEGPALYETSVLGGSLQGDLLSVDVNNMAKNRLTKIDWPRQFRNKTANL
jgi:hypothetical protein